MTSAQPPLPRDVTDYRLREAERKLNDGARAFADIRGAMERGDREVIQELKAVAEGLRHELEKVKPKPASKLQIAAIATAIGLPCLGFIWSLARYPDRSEFSTFKVDSAAQLRETEKRVNELQMGQTLQGRDLTDVRESIKRQEAAQSAINSKLDALLIQNVQGSAPQPQPPTPTGGRP